MPNPLMSIKTCFALYLLQIIGIYIDASCGVSITSLRFDPISLALIEESPSTKLLVDIIYEEEEEE